MVNGWAPSFCFSYFPLNIYGPILPDITTMKFECIHLSILPYISFHDFLSIIEDTFLKLLSVFPMLNLFACLSKAIRYANNTIIIVFLLQLFIEILCTTFVEKICSFPPFMSVARELLNKTKSFFLSWDDQPTASSALH